MSVRRKEVADAPVRILTPATRQLLATRLDSKKVLLTPCGIHRDWRGLAVQAELDVGAISSGKISPTEHCIQLWGKKQGTVGQLWSFLEAMDRFDIIDDTLSMIHGDYDKCKDAISERGRIMIPPDIEDDPDIITVDDQRNLNHGLGLQYYDALVLFADEDIDFVQEMVEKLEGEYNLKLCLKDRDLVGGLQFEMESIVRLIKERCSRVIVVLSPEFFASNVNQFFTIFAQALSIDQRRRIVIPCQLRPCEKPAIISFCHSLDYFRAKGYWNYWEKLRDSLTSQQRAPRRLPGVEPARIEELPASAATEVPASPILNSPSPSSSRNFFSLPKFLRKGDSASKLKLSTSAESTSHQVFKSQKAEEDDRHVEGGTSLKANGHPCSVAIPINKTFKSSVPTHMSVSSASGESTDFMGVVGSLPDVPETPPLSPLSTTSSNALLIPGDTTPSPKSNSKFLDRLFNKGKQRRKDYG